MRKHIKTTRLIVLSAVLALLTVSATGMQTQGYTLNWFTVDGGGGTNSQGKYTVSNTVGQTDAGQTSGSQYILMSGFWNGNILYFNSYLPTIQR